jgi:hypothetical protein
MQRGHTLSHQVLMNAFGAPVQDVPQSSSDLSRCRARNAQQSSDQGRKGKKFPITHVFLLIPKKSNPRAKVVND